MNRMERDQDWLRTLRLTVLLSLLTILGQAGVAAAAPVLFSELPNAGPASFSNASRRVRALLIHGSTLYVGGDFRVSQGGVTKNNLAAFDLAGNLKADFTASPNGTVFALATDGVSLFVGGDFTRLGLKRRLAAVDLATGAINRRFTAHVDGVLDTEEACAVRALSVVSDPSTTPPTVRLIVGGNFTQIDSTTDNRAGLAALYPDSGDLDPARYATGVQGGFVDALLASDRALYVGGSFTQIVGRNTSLAALTFSGAVRNTFATGSEPILDLDLDPVGKRLFAGVGGAGNRVAAFDADGSNRGNPLWQAPRAGGDVQAVHYYAGSVYFGFHDGLFVEPDQYKLAVVDAATGVLEVDAEHAGLACGAAEELVENCWLPTLDNSAGGQGFFGVWGITHFVDPATQKGSLLVGGDFTQIGGVTNTRRFAIFSEP
jgi:outer membrane protein assembly factor BamB